MTTVYFSCDWTNNEKFLEAISRQTPEGKPIWEDIEAVNEPSDAEYHIVFNNIDNCNNKIDWDKSILFCMEPPVNTRCGGWDKLQPIKTYPINDFYKPQRWWIKKSYDELKSLKPPEKTKNLSWITTDNGADSPEIIRKIRKAMMKLGFRKHKHKEIIPTISFSDRRFEMMSLPGGYDGHILRMDFLERLVDSYPDMLDLYGRGDFPYECYNGEVEDKWTGLADYRYSLAIENYPGPNYFTEKITDALLAWCMPIYWGCTNLDEYLPKNSFVEIDIEDPDAPQRVKEIVESDLYQKNLDAIAEARRLLLDEYQIWPTTERVINEKI